MARGSNRTVAGLKPEWINQTAAEAGLFKSDRCGIETRSPNAEPSELRMFKSDRCGIETKVLSYHKTIIGLFKSDRCGVVFIRALYCTKIQNPCSIMHAYLSKHLSKIRDDGYNHEKSSFGLEIEVFHRCTKSNRLSFHSSSSTRR